MTLLFRCPCGREVHSQRQESRHRQKHPRFAEITADLAKEIHISVIRTKYNLKRNQAAGLYARHWERVRRSQT